MGVHNLFDGWLRAAWTRRIALEVSAGRARGPCPGARLAPATGQDHGKWPHRLYPGEAALGQAELTPSHTQLHVEPHEQAEHYCGGADTHSGPQSARH